MAAQEIFRDVGKMLKNRRESDDLYSIYSYIEDEGEDPAVHDQALDQQLNENEKIGTDNLNKVRRERRRYLRSSDPRIRISCVDKERRNVMDYAREGRM